MNLNLKGVNGNIYPAIGATTADIAIALYNALPDSSNGHRAADFVARGGVQNIFAALPFRIIHQGRTFNRNCTLIELGIQEGDQLTFLMRCRGCACCPACDELPPIQYPWSDFATRNLYGTAGGDF